MKRPFVPPRRPAPPRAETNPQTGRVLIDLTNAPSQMEETAARWRG